MPGTDLHVHSTASDGECEPAEVVRRAKAAGLDTIALTDHDTIDGVAQAQEAGVRHGLRVITGCEFSVGVAWGEMHLLAYFLPQADGELNDFLAGQRGTRRARMQEIVRRLRASGVSISAEDVLSRANGAVGRPHVARVLVERGAARDVQDAFDRFLGVGRPAYVGKALPPLHTVTRLVRGTGGVTSAAHLKDRVSAGVCEMLRSAGVDGIEVLHPSHDAAMTDRTAALAQAAGLLSTGGSDWHGDVSAAHGRLPLGGVRVPQAWVTALEELHSNRLEHQEAVQ